MIHLVFYWKEAAILNHEVAHPDRPNVGRTPYIYTSNGYMILRP